MARNGAGIVVHRQQMKITAMVAPATQQVAENSGETALVEALIGVQGRGRSASSKQLQVFRNSLVRFPIFYDLSVEHIWVSNNLFETFLR